MRDCLFNNALSPIERHELGVGVGECMNQPVVQVLTTYR